MKKTFNFLGSLLLFATIFGWGGNEDGFYMVDRNTTSLTFETIWNGHYNQNLKIYPNVRRK